MPLPRLTAEEKILLHLADWMRAFEDYERPPEVTQHGIADSTSIKRGYVAIVLGKMTEKGSVEVGLSRIRGKARSHKTYFLTPEGYAEAARLLDSLKPCTVMIDASEVHFSHAVRSGLSPMQVVSLAEMASEMAGGPPPCEASAPESLGASPAASVPPAEPSVPAMAAPDTEMERDAAQAPPEGVAAIPPAEAPPGEPAASPAATLTGPAERMPAVPPVEDRPPPGPPTRWPAPPPWDEPRWARVPQPPSAGPSIDTWRFLLTIAVSAGTVLLLTALTLERGSTGRTLAYVPGLVFMAVSIDLARRSAWTDGPTVITAFVLVHLSYMVRGTSSPDAAAVPLVAISLVLLRAFAPRQARARSAAMAGTLLVLHGVASAVPGTAVPSGQPEAWIVVGAAGVVLGGGGWRLSAEGLRGVCLGAGLFALALAPFYALDRFDDPLWAAAGGYAAAAGVALIVISTTRRPLRRMLWTASLVSLGTAMLALAWTLARFGLPTAALVELAIGAMILVRAGATCRLRKHTDAVLAAAIGIAPGLVLVYGLARALQ